jgi:exonuclease III
MWNVLSLYRTGTLQNLIEVMQEYKIDLLAVQEVRWLGRSITEKDCRIYYSCDDEKNIFGAGFIVSKYIGSRVIICKPIDMRLLTLRIRSEFKNYSFICARVPTEGRVKDGRIGYMRLKRMYKQFPSQVIKKYFM